MLLWLRNCSFFLKHVAVTNVLEGYPSRLAMGATIFWFSHIFLMFFDGSGGAPVGDNRGVVVVDPWILGPQHSRV